MPWDVNDYPQVMAGLDYIIRAKAFEIASSMDEDGQDEDTLLSLSTQQAQHWFDNASEEEKEDLRKRYPEDQLHKD